MYIIPKAQQQTTQWSGGTTTQLFIYPPEAEYTQRNFEFRISTATVEVETSTFTSLPGYERILMILKGALLIEHRNQYEKKLLPFEMDRFDGGWQTSAQGKVTDFNIMFAKGKEASLASHAFHAGETFSFHSKPFSFGYLVSGNLQLNERLLTAGDFVAFEEVDIVAHADTACRWLMMEIR